MASKINSYKELRVYREAIELAIEVFEVTKAYPKEERYSLTDQMRRSSRSVCANTAEAWRKRRYRAAFIAKLSDVETEACETQVWLEMSARCKYITTEVEAILANRYEKLIAQIVTMIDGADKWTIKGKTSGIGR
jgi:four helix bundle protein